MDKNLDRLDKLTSELQYDVITSISNIHILKDINELISEKNRVVMSNPVLFKSIIREFEMSLSVKLERLLEDGKKANFNEVIELVEYLKHSVKDKKKLEQLEATIELITLTKKDAVVIDSREWRNKRFAHLAKDYDSLKFKPLKYEDFYATFNSLAIALNSISGILWDKSTNPRIVGDDKTLPQMRSYAELEKQERLQLIKKLKER